ncbi:MAG: ATP-binding cassette domain-containing protein [Dokdonia sp.]|jgi:ABC-type multidrug transport system ATPase subunit
MKKLSVIALSKRFGKHHLLDAIALDLAQGQIVGLFGRNGSGKSTLLQILFGVSPANTLDLRYNDQKITPKTLIRSQILGCLPQQSFLPKHMKVRDVIPLFHPQSETQDRIFYAPHIPNIAHQKIGALSLGQARYLEVLLLLHLPHQFLLLDEPFSMIEPKYKEAIKKIIISLKAKKGILITDHYYQDVLDISDRNLVLTKGKLHQADTISALQEMGYLGTASS